jgi:ADP-ribose pyrophosphatase YjhB (NUDIX family)
MISCVIADSEWPQFWRNVLMGKLPATEAEFLASYDPKKFDAPLATVDVTIFTVINGSLNVLLVRRNEFPYMGEWSLPGGFIDLVGDDDLNATAMRKLKDKTGVDAPYLEQVGTVGGKGRDPRGWSLTVLYFALMSSEKVSLRAGSGASEVAWRPVQNGKVEEALAFDHEELLKKALERLKNKARYTMLPGYVLPEEFTLTELINIYRVLLEEDIDNPMMRRRLLRTNLLEETGGFREGDTRPAKLFRFAREAAQHVFERNLEGGR